MTTKNKTWDAVIIGLFSEFYFICFLLHVEELSFCFQCFSFNCNLDFLSVMTNNQTKCSIIYEKIAMRVGDGERMINYEWPNIKQCYALLNKCLLLY